VAGTGPSRRGEIYYVISASGLANIDAGSGRRGDLAVRRRNVIDVRQKLVAETLSRRMREVVVWSTIDH